MGSFTEVRNPATGRYIQFKCGHDSCERFEVGDEVPYWISPSEAGGGYLLDDAYLGTEDASDDPWRPGAVYRYVIVKDRRIHAIVDPIAGEDGPVKDGEVNQAAYWRLKFGVELPPLSLWGDDLWAAKALQDEESRRRQAQWAAEDLELAPEERLLRGVNRFMRAKMREDGIFRRLCPPVPAAE